MSEGLIKDFLDEAKGRMQKSVDATKGEFATVRTGLAPAASASCRWEATTSATSSILARGISSPGFMPLPMRVNARRWSTSARRPSTASARSTRVVFDPMSMQPRSTGGRLP